LIDVKINKHKKKLAPPKEKTIQTEIVSWLKQEGFSVDVITVGAYGSKGIADIVGCLPDGTFLGIEVKRPNGKATELQDLWIKDKLKSNAICFVAHSVEECKELLRGFGYVA
jgi:Holliday junction resolvase